MSIHKFWSYVIAAAILSLNVVASPGEDWSQFRGPNGTGISSTTGLPAEFGPGRNMFWKTSIPGGHSSPVLSNSRIFLTGSDGNKLFVIALDRKTGKMLWQREVPRSHSGRLLKPNNPSSPSPVTDGENVYAFFQDFGLISFDKHGKERWKMPLGPFNIFFGFGSSPILIENKLVLACDQDSTSFLLAVDKDSGKVKWRVDRPGVISGYSTPILYKAASGPTQIVIPESFQLSAYSCETGERIWWVRGLACEMKSIAVLNGDTLYINGWGMPENQPGKQVKIPPFEEILAKFDTNKDGTITQDEGPDERIKSKDYFAVFDLNRDGKLDAKEWATYRAMMASENGLLSIKMGGRGDMTDTAIRWKYQKPVPQVPSTLLYKGVLYMVNDGGLLISFDPASGAVLKQGRLQGAIDKYFASPVAADDKIFLVSEGGAVSVLKAAGEWEILAVNKLDDECFATPAIAEGRIYLRTESALYCFGK